MENQSVVLKVYDDKGVVFSTTHPLEAFVFSMIYECNSLDVEETTKRMNVVLDVFVEDERSYLNIHDIIDEARDNFKELSRIETAKGKLNYILERNGILWMR